MKKILFRLIGVLIVLAAAWAAYSFVKQFDTKQEEVATTLVRQGDVIIRTYTRGELRAVRSSTLTAPNLFGTVQITRLAPLGAVARDKDLIVEFDDSEVQSRLEEKELEMEQLDEQLKKATSELEIRNNQDQVELLKARYAVRRSELEVKRNELLSDIDKQKNLLSLQESQRRLKQLESDIKSRLASSQAELAVLREKKNKAVLELQREKARLMQVKLLAPMSGLVAIRQSRPMGMYYPGMQLPDYREGDQVFPGTPVADVLDLSELEVAAKVGELDRANLNEGQDVTMRLDAVPEKVFHGKIKNLSGTASANVWSADPAKKFDVLLSVDMRQLLSGLGASPEQIKRVIETAERNRSKPAANTMMARLGGPGGMPGGMPGGAPGTFSMQVAGGPGGPEAGAPEGQAGQGERRVRRGGGEGGGQEGRQGGGREGRIRGEGGGREGAAAGEGGERRRFGGNLSEDQQKQLREAMQKLLAGRNPQDLSPEDQQKMREEMRKLFQSMGAGGGQRPGAEGGGAAGAGGMRVFSMQRPGGAEGGPGGAPGPGASPGASPMMMPMGFGMGGSQQFTEKDLANAKLPPPPEEDNQLEVLLRPGLLADVEIIVDKVPNAIHIPVQAVFDKEGKPIVFVKKGDQFEERLIKPLKRSESTMVIAEGLKAGEIVALKDPNAKPGDKKKGGKDAGKKPGGGVPAAPVGGGRAS